VSVVGARLRDVSPYGMLIESPVALPVDSELQFRLVVEGEKADVEARVAVCTPLSGPRRAYGVGLEFTRIDEAVRARLARVVAGAGT
jgi:Tfp pilus assembly protein PilZ